MSRQKHSVEASSKAPARRMRLLAGVSALALVVPVASAQAQTYPGSRNYLFINPSPQDGRNAYSDGFIFKDYYAATAGVAGAPLTITNNSQIRNIDPTQIIWKQAIAPSVIIGSVGGKGGAGLKRDLEGAAGGAGGDVTVFQNATMALGTFNATAPTSLVSIFSRGGQGGAGMVYSESQFSSPQLYASSGAGGAGGNIRVVATTGMETEGDFVGGFLISSKGGNGGDGGIIDEDVPRTAGAGTGGSAGLVTVNIAKGATVKTTGRAAAGIVVESVGGNGSGAPRIEDGRGAAGGNAFNSPSRDSIVYENAGTVSTAGEFAPGVLLQSVGGAGGQGGLAAVSRRGARGGAGGDGGNIRAVQSGRIDTTGSYSYAIVAQSVGGTGGNGGSGVASGGSGGAAGSGGTVNVTTSDTIRTSGKGSTAVVAQSVGGGKAVQAFQSNLVTPPITGGGTGGSGGFLWFSSGGDGGSGGNGGAVTVNNNSYIWVDGASANGVLAQSIGGGGGGGGSATAFGLIFSVSQGGSGGGGGNGGTVTVNNQRAQSGNGGIYTSKNDSAGILAQSIGGGGGSGGEANAVSVGVVASAATAIGGSGGAGGSGSLVTINNGFTISTEGTRSYGVEAMSIGGGGGDGGASFASAYAIGVDKRLPNIAVAVAIGGTGGGGGNGGDVTVNNSGLIATRGSDSFGIMGVSIGGGGGDGGFSDANAVSIGAQSVANLAVSVGVGGSGAVGGSGGTVTLNNSDRITTQGDQAIGIVGYSIGGGGGIGGGADVMGSIYGKNYGVTVDVAVGGKGGAGNTGGKVEVNNTGSITTDGYAASGIHALSAGGGGGNGGDGMAKSSTSLSGPLSSLSFLPVSSAKTLAVNVGVGGSGGSGSNGGAVKVTNSNAIVTNGVDAKGILAQSIGGGGGVGGAGGASSSNNVQVNVSVGAKGGGASDGGEVRVTNASTASSITTYGEGAYGIHAQSIGGGGGTGGSASSDAGDSFLTTVAKTAATNAGKELVKKILPNLSAKYKIGASVPISVSVNNSVGGAGGAAGNGKLVIISNDGTVTTNGQIATAILAQSIGGGGGQGGASTVAGGKLINAKIASGGDGGSAGDGGDVTVTNSGTLGTAGDTSFGILAQSIGGGGGLATLGIDRSGFSLDSPALTTGGQNGSKGAGKSVTVTNSGTITTAGAQSHGIVAQSVGGGGGLVAVNVFDPYAFLTLSTLLTQAEKDALKSAGLDITKVLAEGAAAKSAATAQTESFKLQLGATGASGGNGGAVTVNTSGTITTTGANAFGILAQSVGGGGGFMTNGAGSGIDALKITGRLGGSADSFGTGGEVLVTLGNSSKITTSGVGAVGIFAQSVGGGGGYTGALDSAGATFANLLPKNDPSKGTGGGILINMAGAASTMTIETSGKNAHGIYAQSVGGGGGAVGTGLGISLPVDIGSTTNRDKATRGGGPIEIDLRGSIAAVGENAVGIYAQSGAQGSSGRVVAGTGSAIRVGFGGTLTGGTGTGAAVQIDGGADNQIEFRAGSTVSAKSGIAVLATNGSDTLRNYGNLTGDVKLAVGGTTEVNTFVNQAGGTYTSSLQGIIDVGRSGTFRNEGIFNIGGSNVFATATVTGAYNQTTNGSVIADVARIPSLTQSDLLKLNGTAVLAGQITANVAGGLMPGRFKVVEFGQVGDSFSLKAAGNPYGPFRWSVERDGSSLFIAPTADFKAPLGLTMTTSETSQMKFLQSIWNSGAISEKDALVFGNLANVTSASDYERSIDSATPEESASVMSLQTLNAMTSMNMALSCPVFAGSGTLMEETECAWARIIGDWTTRNSSASASGYNQTAATYRVGVQRELTTDWFFGATVGFTQSWLSGNDGLSNTTGNAVDAALSLKHQVGPWLFAVSGHLGYGSFDTDRVFDIGPSIWQSSGTANVLTAAGRFRASYEFAFSNWYLKPYADVDLLYTYVPAYNEQGISGTNLQFSSAQQWNVAVTPTLEFGSRIDLNPQTWLRPYGAVGMSFFANDSMNVGVNFSNSSALVPDFVTTVVIPSTLVNLTAGLQLFDTSGYELRAEYKADIGDNYISHEASARFSVSF